MFKESYHVIGVMSGTSLDGIDLAEVILTHVNNNWSYQLLHTETVGYSLNWVNKLKNAIHYSKPELKALNEDYTILLASEIKDFMSKNNIKKIDAICSHGHTILHQPQNRFTLQIGNLPKLATLTHQTVVCDFRVQDVELGGQGAPLVPIGDAILFSDYDFCLNLGGFTNISLQQNGKRIAFDIAAANTVLNFYANQLGYDYDANGAIAQAGTVNHEMLNALNNLKFFRQKAPKSLGFEFVQETILPLISSYNNSVENNIATFTNHIAYQVAKTIKYYNSFSNKNSNLLITGGGAYNLHLIYLLKKFLPETEIIIPDAKTLEFKEALLFGLLGVLRLRKEVNVLASVTGANHDHSSGKIYFS